MSILKWLFTVCVVVYSAQFTSGPNVLQNGNSATITFAISEMADVEVAVIGEDGTVLRHIAAGVLGGTYNPPLPLQPGLAQTIVWDGKDDNGDFCLSMNVKIRVRIGVLPDYDTTFDAHDIFPSTYQFYPGGLDPKYTYRPPTDPFLSMKSFNGVPLYEQEQRIEISADNKTGNILVNGVAESQGLAKISATVFRIDGKTGKVLHVINGNNLVFDSTAHYEGQGRANYDWTGKYYYYRCASNVYRFDLNGNPAPWPETGSHVVRNLPFNDIGSAGICAGPDSSVYVIHYIAEDTMDPQCISKIKNGVVQKSRFIKIAGSMAGGVRVDKYSNIYVGARVKEAGKAWPDFVEGDSLTGSICEMETSQKAWAYEMYGSVLKFDSTGGSILGGTTGNLVLAGAGFHPGNCATWQNYHKCTTNGLIWMHYGMSHILTHTAYRITRCWCAQTRFDVDGYGRIFYPNTFMCEFAGIDNNKNMLFRIKNRDLPSGVAIGVGNQIEVTDAALYVVDYFNNKIVRFNWVADSEWFSGNISTSVTRTQHTNGELSLSISPNPLNSICNIVLFLPIASKIQLEITSINGQQVRLISSSMQIPGQKEFIWDATNVNGNSIAPGIYFCKLTTENASIMRKIILLR